MSTLQFKIISDLGVQSKINPKEEIEKRISFLKRYLIKSDMSGYVLGISGGQDSSLAGRLAQLTIEELRKETGKPYRFIALRLPYGIQKDELDAQRALAFIHADEVRLFNIKGAVDVATKSFQDAIGMLPKDYHKGNIKARMRMLVQYAVGGQENLLVIGTDHAAEAITGFFTKFGDGGADVTPLSGLTKRQGKALLMTLGANSALWEKTPTADLLDDAPAQADETELGLTYDQIDDYLEGREVEPEVARKLDKRYLDTRHKRAVPVATFDTWW